MLISEFDYDLPEELIAQKPPEKREESRMLSVDRTDGSLRDLLFTDFPHLITENDVLVVNNTKVFPARLIGRSETGAKIELFLVDELEEKIWMTLAKPVRRLKPGKRVLFGDDLSAVIREITAEGRVKAEFECEGGFEEALDAIGRTPLPPYIKREGSDPDSDRRRYQTVYAKYRGSIAAPTAGFHFTQEIIERVKKSGAAFEEITLHVGYGTFEPVRVDDLAEHAVQPEMFSIDAAVAERLNAAKEQGKRIVAVGTTTTRALETCVSRHGEFTAGAQTANLTIIPGYNFKAIDALLTNFHLPKSSLLVLVSTFGGHELIMNAYRHAVSERYRFYSYGDCMFVS